MVLLLFGWQQPGKEPLAQRDSHDERPGGLAGAAAQTGHLSAEERAHLRDIMRSASSVSPYLFIWVIPGSMLLLPFMAWFLDKQRKRRERKLLR